MKIGVNVVMSETLDAALIARRAAELGFDSLWIPEHPIVPVHTTSRYDGTDDGSIPERMVHIPDPFVGLARALAATQTIKLGTGEYVWSLSETCCFWPRRSPHSTSSSGRRFLFGIGAG